jgi:hypothetical protein
LQPLLVLLQASTSVLRAQMALVVECQPGLQLLAPTLEEPASDDPVGTVRLPEYRELGVLPVAVQAGIGPAAGRRPYTFRVGTLPAVLAWLAGQSLLAGQLPPRPALALHGFPSAGLLLVSALGWGWSPVRQ